MIDFWLTSKNIHSLGHADASTFSRERPGKVSLLACLDKVADTVGKTMLSWVEVRVLSLLLSLHLLENLAFLLLRQLLAINARVLADDSGKLYGIFFVFDGALVSRRLLLELRRLNVVFGSLEIKFDVSLNAANLIFRFTFDNINGVVTATILDVDRVTLVKHGIVSEFLLENRLRIAKVNECCLVRANLHIASFLQIHVTQDNFATLLNAQVVHHPDGDVAHAFFSREFKHTTEGLDSHLRVRNHKRHRVLNAEPGELVKRRSRQDN